MNKMPSKMQIEMLRECYPKGMRVQLDRMYDDPYPIQPGTKGTVEGIDDYGHLMMKWDNGRTPSLVWDKDSFHKIGMENVPAAERYPHLVGYAIDGNKRLRSIEAVAEFICTHGQYGDVQIKNDDGFELISTNGVMIEKIADEEYGEELMKIYLQLQEQTEDEDMGETEDVDMTM